MIVFYFTATGNCLSVAKELGGELYSIPKLLKTRDFEFEADKIGFVIPTYYMGVPRIVKDFLSKVKLRSEYIFVISTYGGNVGAGVSQFKRIAEKAGIRLAYTNELKMIENYLPFFEMKEEIAKLPSRNVKGHLSDIINDISCSKEFHKDKRLHDKVMTSLLHIYYDNRKKNIDRQFTVDDSCVSCKICEKVCPVDNIDVNIKPVYNGNCEECLACIHLCPQNAISMNREKSKARYQNEDVKLSEIIKANQ